jgi:uncharacterized protein
MSFDISIIIILTSIIQSIFGTGVLLFGTPLLLLSGYDFQYSLQILLPTSILINFLQLRKNFIKIDISFYKKLVAFCLPPIALFLYLISVKPININIIIGLILIIIALKETSRIIEKSIALIIKKEFIYLIITGIIHGLSNLGGALLSAIVFSKKLSKDSTRATIAISYLTFAIFQILTIIFIIGNNSFFTLINIFYWLIGTFVFIIVENTFYFKINEKKYTNLFTGFIFCIGIFLLLKDLIK